MDIGLDPLVYDPILVTLPGLVVAALAGLVLIKDCVISLIGGRGAGLGLFLSFLKSKGCILCSLFKGEFPIGLVGLPNGADKLPLLGEMFGNDTGGTGILSIDNGFARSELASEGLTASKLVANEVADKLGVGGRPDDG